MQLQWWTHGKLSRQAQQWVPPKWRLLLWLVFIASVTHSAEVESMASRHSSELKILLRHCLNSLLWAHLSPSSFALWTWDTIRDWRACYWQLNPLQRKTLLVHSKHQAVIFKSYPEKMLSKCNKLAAKFYVPLLCWWGNEMDWTHLDFEFNFLIVYFR